MGTAFSTRVCSFPTMYEVPLDLNRRPRSSSQSVLATHSSSIQSDFDDCKPLSQRLITYSEILTESFEEKL